LSLQWDFSCSYAALDYEVYEGVLGNFTSHVPRLCSTGGDPFANISPPGGSAYYLVVATTGAFEGSYGKNNAGVERARSTAACMPQSLGSCP
jgi:hypothetical protein